MKWALLESNLLAISLYLQASPWLIKLFAMFVFKEQIPFDEVPFERVTQASVNPQKSCHKSDSFFYHFRRNINQFIFLLVKACH